MTNHSSPTVKDLSSDNGAFKTLTGILGYLHEDSFVLRSIPPGYLAIFFSDFVLRKVMIEPHMYTYIPASIKLFYTFLWEKKYLDNPVPFMVVIDEIEPHFIETLRERFG